MKVGVLGAGQLGRMLALAGYPLGLSFLFVDPKRGAPAGQVAEQLVAAYDEPGALEKLCAADVVTYEFENVPVAAAEQVAKKTTLLPEVQPLRVAQDRLLEKQIFSRLGIPTAKFLTASSPAELQAGARQIGFPCVAKTRRLGYDGKGQMVLSSAADLDRAEPMCERGPLIVERFIEFTRELSIVAVRGRLGETAFYDLVENRHRSGILQLTLAPAPRWTEAMQHRAESLVTRLMDDLDHVGVLALELFECEGELLANEFAPRVHNSGHWSMDGASVGQFENHLRAICGLPLGATETLSNTLMLNFIGRMPHAQDILRIENSHLHDYGKTARPGRKLGHVNVRAKTEKLLLERLEQLTSLYEPLLF